MRTLDDIISEQALATYGETLSDLMNVKLWTTETRDEKLAQLLEFSEEVCAQAVAHTEALLKTEIDGKSVLFWKLKSEFMQGQLDFLRQLWSELHEFSDEELGTIPVDYEWLTTNIRKLTHANRQAEEITERAISSFVTSSGMAASEVQEV